MTSHGFPPEHHLCGQNSTDEEQKSPSIATKSCALLSSRRLTHDSACGILWAGFTYTSSSISGVKNSQQDTPFSKSKTPALRTSSQEVRTAASSSSLSHGRPRITPETRFARKKRTCLRGLLCVVNARQNFPPKAKAAFSLYDTLKQTKQGLRKQSPVLPLTKSHQSRQCLFLQAQTHLSKTVCTQTESPHQSFPPSPPPPPPHPAPEPPASSPKPSGLPPLAADASNYSGRTAAPLRRRASRCRVKRLLLGKTCGWISIVRPACFGAAAVASPVSRRGWSGFPFESRGRCPRCYGRQRSSLSASSPAAY